MEKKDLRIVFMGTPEFAVETLKALLENEYNVVAVVTRCCDYWICDYVVGNNHESCEVFLKFKG